MIYWYVVLQKTFFWTKLPIVSKQPVSARVCKNWFLQTDLLREPHEKKRTIIAYGPLNESHAKIYFFSLLLSLTILTTSKFFTPLLSLSLDISLLSSPCVLTPLLLQISVGGSRRWRRRGGRPLGAAAGGWQGCDSGRRPREGRIHRPQVRLRPSRWRVVTVDGEGGGSGG